MARLDKIVDPIEDTEVARLWAIHFPKYKDDVKSKTLCLAMYYMITEKAKVIIMYGDWTNKIHQSAMFFGVPTHQYWEFAPVAKEFE